MSLSKSFKLQKLPRVAFENVLHQMYPLDLLELSKIPSKKFLKAFKSSLIALHCDIKFAACYQYAKLTITMRSGYTLKWYIIERTAFYKRRDQLWSKFRKCYWEGKAKFDVINDGLKLDSFKSSSTDKILSVAYINYNIKYTGEPLFSELLSKFPCPIRTFSLPSKQESIMENYVFNWKTIRTCKNLKVHCSESNYFQKVLDVIDVTDQVTIDYFLDYPTTDVFANQCLKNIKKLNLTFVHTYTSHILNQESNHEHYNFEFGYLKVGAFIQFFKDWQSGRHPRLKTLKCSSCDSGDFRLIPGHLDLELSMPKNSPKLVKCSYVYLDTTVRTDVAYRTILIKNCHGQLATLVVNYCYLYFGVWDQQPPVKIPPGHRMARWKHWQTSSYPVHLLVPLYPEIFRDDEKVELDREGYLTEDGKYHDAHF